MASESACGNTLVSLHQIKGVDGKKRDPELVAERIEDRVAYSQPDVEIPPSLSN